MKIRAYGIATVLLVLACVGFSPESHALDTETTADLQCLVAVLETGPVIDKLAPGTSQTAMLYFLGKLDGRTPNLDLESELRKLVPTMSKKDLGLADIRCGHEMAGRGQALQTIGQHLMDNPAAPPKPPGSDL